MTCQVYTIFKGLVDFWLLNSTQRQAVLSSFNVESHPKMNTPVYKAFNTMYTQPLFIT